MSTREESFAPSAGESTDATTPLLIDLDHALIRADLPSEAALAYLTANPLRILHFLAWTFRGRACSTQQLMKAATPDPQLIPLNDGIVELALEAKRRGRQVFAVTGSGNELARRVAACLPFLDGVVSSVDTTELTGSQKAALVREHLHGAYDYVGASADDLDVWGRAHEKSAPSRQTEPHDTRSKR